MAHLRLDLDDAALGAALPAFDQSIDNTRHGWGKSRGHLPAEHRRQHAPLSLPLLAAHRDESVAHAHCEHAPLNGAFAVDLLVFDENLANGRRIAHNRNAGERKSTGHNRLIEVGLRPAFKRVRPQCLQECERTERPCLRRRRGRPKTGIGGRVHFQDPQFKKGNPYGDILPLQILQQY